MNATKQAYDFLEAHREGSYEELCCTVLALDGCMVQDATFFLAWIPEDGGRVAHVLFALGDIRKMTAYIKAMASIHGIDSVKWERSIVGKHESAHVFKISNLPNL